MNKGKISVIIPVYNSEKYLGKCLNSILNQSYENIQVIAIDDGSTDQSSAILSEYKNKDSRIWVYRQDNKGVSASRNEGLKFVDGEYVSFVDSDDELEPDMYQFLVDIIQCQKADIAHCGYKRVSETGEIIKEVSGTHNMLIQNSDEASKCLLEGKYFVGGLWNKLFKFDIVKSLHFDEQLKNNEDILFNFEAFHKANKIVFSDETKYRYFEHMSSTCNNLSKIKQAEDAVKASEKMALLCVSEEVEKCIIDRMYMCRINLLRQYLRLDIKNEDMIKDTKLKLKQDYKKIQKPEKKTVFNYYLLTYFPQIYILLYKIYDSIRKPNWDVEV